MEEPRAQPGIFCGGPFQTNGYLVEGADASVLFDAPMGATRWLLDSGKRVDLLVLTHQHHDHVVDAAEISSAFACPIWAFSHPSEDLTLLSRLEEMTGQPWELEEFSVDRLLAEGDSFDAIGRHFRPLHVPGHSPDSLCFYNETDGYLIGGDVLFQGSIGRTDFPHGDHGQLLDGIRAKLWPLPGETIVYPGHGPPTRIAEEKAFNPFLA